MSNRLERMAGIYGDLDSGSKCTCDPEAVSSCMYCCVLEDLQTIEKVMKIAMKQVAASYINLIPDEEAKAIAWEYVDARIKECIERAWKEEE